MTKDYPFMSYIRIGSEVTVGIIQNMTSTTVHVFDFDRIKGDDAKRRFVELGSRWWYGSNTSVPIDVFLGEKFDEFRPALVGYPKRGIDDLVGFSFSLREGGKRIKRRRVEFLGRPK
jgi:hypothetical protein